MSARIGANYISRSIFAIGTAPAFDVYSKARTSVDFGANYAVWKNIKMYLNVKNITNTSLNDSEGTPNRPIQREFYGETFQVGLEGSF